MADVAKVAYKPISLLASLGAAWVAGKVVGVIWKQVADEDEIPTALSTQHSVSKVLAAALIQAGVFAIVHTLIDRGGAKLFEKVTGAWPGD